MRNTDRIVRCLLPEIEGKEVLEVACGTAEFSLSAARWAKRVTCIDIEESRLDERVKKQDNICFRVMDASKMDFEGEAFDTIMLYNAIYHIKDQYNEILEECRRVLKPEGQYLSDLHKKCLRLWLRRGTECHLSCEEWC